MPMTRPRLADTRWRRELEASLGLVLLWAGLIGLWLNAGLLEGRLQLVGFLFRTLVALAIWCLALHSIRARHAAAQGSMA